MNATSTKTISCRPKPAAASAEDILEREGGFLPRTAGAEGARLVHGELAVDVAVRPGDDGLADR